MTNQVKVPIWFWIIAGIAFLWNLMGLYNFYASMTISAESLAALPADQKGLYETMPLWAQIAFGGSVITGVIGSLGLLFRKKWASQILLLSVAFVLAHMAHGFMSGGFEIVEGSLILGVVILVFALFLVWFSRFSLVRAWLS